MTNPAMLDETTIEHVAGLHISYTTINKQKESL